MISEGSGTGKARSVAALDVDGDSHRHPGNRQQFRAIQEAAILVGGDGSTSNRRPNPAHDEWLLSRASQENGLPPFKQPAGWSTPRPRQSRGLDVRETRQIAARGF